MGDRKTSTAKWYENIVYIICLVFFSIELHEALATKPRAVNGMQSMTFPKVIFGIIIVMCAVKLLMNIIWMIRSGEYGFELLDRRILISLVMIIVYAALWQIIGFGLSSVIFVTIESKLLRNNAPWLHCALVGLGTTVVLYFVFGFLFNVDFPEPILEMIM